MTTSPTPGTCSTTGAWSTSSSTIARPWSPAERLVARRGPYPGRSGPGADVRAIWKRDPRALVDLWFGAVAGRSGSGRQRLVRDLAASRPFPPDEMLAWLGHDDAEVVELAAELLGAPRGSTP
jgi:hypothetical protein